MRNPSGSTRSRGRYPTRSTCRRAAPFSDRCERCFDRCRAERPELRTVPGTTRRVRCFLYDDPAEVARAQEATEAAHKVKADLEEQERERIARAAAAARRPRRPELDKEVR